jgi:hypothetical protein
MPLDQSPLPYYLEERRWQVVGWRVVLFLFAVFLLVIIAQSVRYDRMVGRCVRDGAWTAEECRELPSPRPFGPWPFG